MQPVMAVGAKIILTKKNGMNEVILVHKVQWPEQCMYLALQTRTDPNFL